MKALEELTQDEIVLRNLSIPNLLGQCILAVVYIGEEAKRVQAASDLRCVVFLFNRDSRKDYMTESVQDSKVVKRGKANIGCCDWNDEDLTRRYPERPRHATLISLIIQHGKDP